MERYPEYKATLEEIFRIFPQNWNFIKIKYCLSLITDKAFDNNKPKVGLENIEGWTGKFIVTNTVFEGEGIQFNKNDILFGKLRPYLAKVYKAQKDGSAVGDFFVLRTFKNQLPDFFSYLLLSEILINIINGSTFGAKMPRVSWETMANLKITCPSLPEQVKIASFLDHKTAIIDSLVAKKEKQIELLKEQRTALINHVVTKGLNPKAKMKDSGIEWLGEIPEHWEVMAMKHIASLKSGDSITSEAITKDGAYPVFGGNGIRGYYSSFTHDGDFVLIGRQGALCGNINYAWGKFWASEHAVVATMKLDNSVFWFGELLKSMNLNQYSQAAAQPGLAVETIKNLRIPVPSLSEQKEIHLFIKNENKRILDATQKAQKQIAFLKEYRTALISEAVTGKIDVRDWEPTGEKKNFSQRSQSTQRKRG